MHDSILVPIDGSPASEAGLAIAQDMAEAMNVRIVLLHVIDAEPLFLQSARDFEEHRSRLRDYGNDLLATAAVAVQDRGIAVSYQLRETIDSNTAAVITAEAVAQACGLIVLGTHGRRKRRGQVLLGRDAEWVLQNSTVPVMFVRGSASD
ncbi:universal stress protein [Roseateles sp. SL47]|jgi:nucleotide-binding universal stress UspA family protein|uniref:universal stress protein n=1 Tax=Roseateles sp. SL47 TaxID=2995138 RepID=UPI00226EE3BC|nr:universal stress protein [Roseateles sp. SL47]WAC71014.1 universal stress protein [Roseateles sp. SL47]